MRAVLGLLDEREPALRQRLEGDQTTLETMRINHVTDETQLTGKVVLASEQAAKLLGEETPRETDAIVARLDSLAEVLRDGAQGLSKRPPAPVVIAAQKRLKDANKALTLAESELEQVNKQLPELRTRRDRDLTTIRQIKTGNVVDPTRADANFCPRTLIYAKNKGCYVESKPTDESALSVTDLDNQAKADSIAIDALEAKAKKLSGEMSKLESAVEDAEDHLNDATTEANRDLALLLQKAARAEGIAKLYRSIAETREEQTKAADAIKQRGEALDADRATLARLRRDMEDKVVELSNIFADIIRGVMGASVEPNLRVTADGIEPHVSRGSELSGAALDTIKTLAFDLAAVIASIEGKGSHPRFLIHDGPREGDMARVIYERFFIYAAGIEKAFPSPDEASFQYIITTTTPPPKSMREGTRWLLEPVLDSRDKSKRLLKEDF
jgi:predicted  nucleic acid-binding Zn-ribbon protein